LLLKTSPPELTTPPLSAALPLSCSVPAEIVVLPLYPSLAVKVSIWPPSTTTWPVPLISPLKVRLVA